jgi:hypothetical protein
VVGFESEYVEQTMDVDCSLDIFEMATKQVNHQMRLLKQSS